LIAAVAVLYAGISSAHAHVHLCFDGKEAPATIHLVDGDTHAHDHEADGTHDDVDVDIPSSATIAKAFKHDVQFVAPATRVEIAAPEPYSEAPPVRAGPRLPPPPPYSLPQLRAPPR